MSVTKDSVASDPNSKQLAEEPPRTQSLNKSQNVEKKEKFSNSTIISADSNTSIHAAISSTSIHSARSGATNNTVRSTTLTTCARSNTSLVPAHSNSIPTNSQSRRGSLKPNDQSMDSGDATEPGTHEAKVDDQTTNENKAGTKVQHTPRSKSSTTSNIVSLKSITKLFPEFNCDRLRMARETTEKAIKMNKIFTIQGGYATVRNSLRKRGWVEIFFRVTDTAKKQTTKKQSDVSNSDDDDDDDDDVGIDTEVDGPKVKPWEEEGGLYGIMSRMVRNLPPALFWVLRRDIIDHRTLHKYQMINHFARSAVFTTKVGLCVNLRSLRWFDETDPNTFFPRCYRLCHEEEKVDFIDDFNLTACMNILKIVVDNWIAWSALSRDENQREYMTPKTNPDKMEVINDENESEMQSSKFTSEQKIKKTKLNGHSAKKTRLIPVSTVRQALRRCEFFINNKENVDVDMEQGIENMSNAQWELLREHYYQLVHQKSGIVGLPTILVNQCEACLKRLQILCPQFHLDGKNSVWIVKPGAKSRGRGITCYDRLEDILKLVERTVAKRDSRYVIQKYIERPLLIYNCKFDIRQWFLITDWNPLTMYFYKDSYLRFCSQQFTLSKFDESIHLCNNAVQKNYKNGPRAKELPASNMWTHHQFQEYLRNRNLSHIWDDVIYTGMKKAIISAMFVSQELVEPRKGSFELYGADFMLTDDYSPWLIEINSSPSMEASTEVTSRLCAKVLEDTIKVVIDRKYDKNCDIGRFEVGYKRAIVNNPPYMCLNMSVEGQAIKKPPIMARRSIDLPQDTKEDLLTTSLAATKPNGQRSAPYAKKPNSKEGKEVLRENSKLLSPSCCNVFPTKKAVIPVVRELKSPTCLQVCYRNPEENLRPHGEKLWMNKALEINCIRKDTHSYGWIIDREDGAKKNKKFDPKIQKGKTIRSPNATCHSPKNNQIPYVDSRKLRANIKNFRERPKKALVTPIARIKFPLLALQIAKQPYAWRCNQKKNIPAKQQVL